MKDFWLFLKGNKIFIVHSVLWLLPFGLFVLCLIDNKFISPYSSMNHLTFKGIIDREQGIVEITAVHNREMKALPLPFGSDVEVLATATIGATPLPLLERNINNINVC